MTWKEIDRNLAKRKGTSLAACLKNESPCEVTIIQSPNDDGVMRNGGRRGAAYGARVITNNLLKMAKRNFKNSIRVEKISEENQIQKDFDLFQKNQAEAIAKIDFNQTLIHIGGGHDHAYPLVDSLFQKYEHITVINLDAHLDTRADEIKHSGTPFRQLKDKYKDKLELIQVGIHDFANVDENYEQISMKVTTVNQLKKLTNNFNDNKTFIQELLRELDTSKTQVVLSLDIDAIDSTQMKAVSAVNHDGLLMSFINEFFSAYKDLEQRDNIIGLYEYNPLYDDISCSGARLISASLYNFIMD